MLTHPSLPFPWWQPPVLLSLFPFFFFYVLQMSARNPGMTYDVSDGGVVDNVPKNGYWREWACILYSLNEFWGLLLWYALAFVVCVLIEFFFVLFDLFDWLHAIIIWPAWWLIVIFYYLDWMVDCCIILPEYLKGFSNAKLLNKVKKISYINEKYF